MTGRASVASGALPLVALLAACGDGPPVVAEPLRETYNDPVYVIESLIFNDEGSTSYVVLRPELEQGPNVALTDAREFAGFAPAEAVGGTLIVSSGEQPTVRLYSVSDRSVWIQEAVIGFSRFTSAALEANVAVSDRKVYVPFDTTNHATYDTQTFNIGVEVGAPEDIPLARDGLPAWRGYAHELRGTTLFQPYYYASDDFRSYGPASTIALIDVATDAIAAPSVEVPCPHLHISTADEQGNLYFSNGQGSIAAALVTPGQAPNCFARVNAGEQSVDPTSITRFRDLTDGREGSNFFYIGDGKALFNVYHAEREPTVSGDFDAIDRSASYHLWTFDLATGQAAMLEGIDFAGGQFVATRIDDRTLVTIPAPDYSSTAFYEVYPSGSATHLFDVEGWAFKTFRLR